MAPVRLRDVADRAGVSLTTASVVVRRLPGVRVSPETRNKIHAVAAEIGYVPRERRPDVALVGVGAAGSVAAVNHRFLDLLVAEAGRRSGAIILVPDELPGAAISDAAFGASDRDLDGLVVLGRPVRPLPTVARLSGRVVVVDPGLVGGEPAESVATIVPDDEAAAREVGEVIRRSGRGGSLAVLGSEIEEMLVREWCRGLSGGVDGDVAALSCAPEDLDTHLDPGRSDRPSVVVAMSERSAAEAVLAAARVGLAIPRDLILVVRSWCSCLIENLGAPPVRVPVPAEAMASLAMASLLPGPASGGLVRVPYVLPPTLGDVFAPQTA